MANRCPRCSHENADEVRFCSNCGEALRASAHFESAERRRLTVFFSDVSGYTAMSEALDPEDVREIMNRVFDHARDIVEKYGGRIDKLIGDAVMAVFGDPVAHEDDAERAIRAALDLHEAVERLSPEVESRIGRPVAMHTGVNTGLVVTGGPDFDNAIGDAINVASRLEDLSEPGEILIGPQTAEAVAGVFSLEEHGSHELKGKEGPVRVTKVAGLAPNRVEPSRRQSDFVGRHEELGILLGAVERMRGSQSSVITISGEAGTGKTRLLNEFHKRLPKEVQWLEGRAYAYGENIPYAAVIDLLRRAVGIAEDDDPRTVETKLSSAVADLAGDAEKVFAPLKRLFGLESPEAGGLERETYRSRLADSVRALTDSLAAREPTVLVFQDLHWADPSTVDLIEGLVDRIEAPITVVANYRPPFDLQVSSQRQLDLTELSPRQVGELVKSLLDGQDPPESLVEFLVDRTNGNPFFVEEIVNSLIETGTLRRPGSEWQIHDGLDEAGLPNSVKGVIAARIDRLEPTRRRVLREASVVGREFLYDVVAGVTSIIDELDSSLDDLESTDLIRKKEVDPDLEYLFKHALTQDVAYEGLLRAEREQLHTRTAEAIERQFKGRLEEVTETLAFHWSRSSDDDKAIRWLTAAAKKAMERFALQESQAHYEKAYQLLQAKTEGPVRDRGIVELILQWAHLAYYQARLRSLGELLTENQDAVDRVGNPEERGMWLAWLGHVYWLGEANNVRATDLLDQALSIGRESDNLRVIAYAQTWRTYSLMLLGRTDEAMQAGQEAQEISPQLPTDPYVWFKSKGGIGFVHAFRGDFAEMRRVADELLEFGSRTGSARSKAMAGWLLTILAYLTEDERMAAKTIELAMESGGDPIYEHSPSMWRLPTLIVSGKIEEARRYHDDHYQRFVIERDIRGMADGLQIANGVLLVHEGQPEKGFDQVEQLRDEAVAAGEISKARMCEAVLAMMYAGVAMADLGIGEILSNLGFALRRGFRARREARRRLDYLLSHLDEWDLGGYRFLLELTFSRFLIDRDETGAAEEHLRRAVDAAEPAGDTAGLREAHRLLEQVVAHH